MAVVKVEMYSNDLKPDLTVRLERETAYGSGTYVPVDLSDATALRVIATLPEGSVWINRDVLATSTAGLTNGLVTMLWEPPDTDLVGILRIEIEVMWPGDKPETFRPAQVYLFKSDWG